MRAVIQRVTQACVSFDDEVVGEIGEGLVVLIGIARNDSKYDVKYMVEKISTLRIFDDEEGKMNLSVAEVDGELLIVSQFTLYGDVRKGRRPSWSEAAVPEIAVPLYAMLIEELKKEVRRVETGKFRAMMELELVNDGPVTILVDSKKQF